MIQLSPTILIFPSGSFVVHFGILFGTVQNSLEMLLLDKQNKIKQDKNGRKERKKR